MRVREGEHGVGEPARGACLGALAQAQEVRLAQCELWSVVGREHRSLRAFTSAVRASSARGAVWGGRTSVVQGLQASVARAHAREMGRASVADEVHECGRELRNGSRESAGGSIVSTYRFPHGDGDGLLSSTLSLEEREGSHSKEAPMATEGGGDEKPQSKGPELSQPTGGIAQSEPTDGSQQRSPFITSEPLREDQVQNAVKFLSHPKVRGSPVIYRRSFLERKGLTKEEIDEAFLRVPDPPPNATTAETVSTRQATQVRPSTSLQPQASVQTAPPAASQVGAVSLTPMSQKPRFNWSHALIAIGVLSASGAGSAVIFKRVVLPRLKAWIRRVAVEDKEDRATKSLAAETAEAAKAAASAAAIVATASQELLNSKNEDRKYFEAFMGMIDVQVKEMKSMSEAIHKLEKAREQEKLIDEYVQYATANGNLLTPNGTSNNSWKPSQANHTLLNQVRVNGTSTTSYGAEGQSLAPASVEPTTASHPKSYMEIMAMVQRGEKPPNIKEINDTPPNPNQPPSKPLIAPRTKPWEITQQIPVSQPQENGQSQDISSEPWWRKKSVKITELEPEGEEPLRQLTTNDWPSSQRTWVPPQPPSVAIPESAAAIRHPKPSLPIQDLSSGDEKMSKSSINSNAVSQQSEIEEVPERDDGV
ncbi:hypothetical protein IEQ34_002702 [Dendrobium chrysotoxum]|uniref:Peroxisomal membrane protein PEX14 n=1 Tax=Dendrobium chrysotoxum TaxID=161865 RepID=A0AAV7H1L0_DENCH|nr:hypothetical protein IEQ34_002702 [Dendrobium chrysotoxum]